MNREDMMKAYAQIEQTGGFRFVPVDEAKKKALNGALRSYAKVVRRENVVLYMLFRPYKEATTLETDVKSIKKKAA